jgi:hypothetical protein
VTAGILIIHTSGQLDDASTLVDLLEASLPLPAGAIACSSLPGYAWANRASSESDRAQRFSAVLDGASAAIALVDAAALGEPQLWFDVAAVWSRGKRVALVTDTTSRKQQVPLQLTGNGSVIEREDRDALVSLIEDLAFDLGVRPRIGHDAQRAIELLSSAPPPPLSAADSTAPRAPELDAPTVRATVVVPNAHVAALEAEEIAAVDEAVEAELGDAYELSDNEVEQLEELDPLEDVQSIDNDALDSVSCQLSLEAGRAISTCSFHPDALEAFATDLERSFGCFVDAVGGNWLELKRLGDTELWLGATDNLLDTLGPKKKYIADWYEVGFQFAALQSIAEQGIPEDPEQRAAYQEAWQRSMDAFQKSAEKAAVPPREVRRQRALLENLIGPASRRDYANAELSLHELRALAEAADRQGAA